MANEDAEEDYDAFLKDVEMKMKHKFGAAISAQLLEVLSDLFETKAEVVEDAENEEWDESAVMDVAQSEKNAFKDDKMCETVYRVLQQIVTGKYHEDYAGAQLLPSQLDWNVDAEDIESAQQWMQSLCAEGRFPLDENQNLYKTMAVGRKNQVELLTMMMEIYELAHVDELVTPKANRRNFSDQTAWAAKSKFLEVFSNDNANTLKRAIAEYCKRISGGGPSTMITNPIEDDINVYIEYTLLMSQIIHNLTTSQEEICPFQVDVVILGKKHSPKDDTKQDEDAEDEDDDDDDDDDEVPDARSLMANGALQNQLPKTVSAILRQRTIDFAQGRISAEKPARTIRAIQGMIKGKMNGQRNQRIIVVIDRSNHDAEAEAEDADADADDEKDEEGSDGLFVYQLQPTWDKIQSVDNELHMAWKTKMALMPCWKREDNLVGGATDIGDNNFVFSFHVHAADRVKCDQWIKAQKVPFLPYQMAAAWPMYFAQGHGQVDAERYGVESIYERFKVRLQHHDERLMQWIKTIDPVFYERLQQKHLPYVGKDKEAQDTQE